MIEHAVWGVFDGFDKAGQARAMHAGGRCRRRRHGGAGGRHHGRFRRARSESIVRHGRRRGAFAGPSFLMMAGAGRGPYWRGATVLSLD